MSFFTVLVPSLLFLIWPRFAGMLTASVLLAWSIDAWTPIHSTGLSWAIVIFGAIAGTANQIFRGAPRTPASYPVTPRFALLGAALCWVVAIALGYAAIVDADNPLVLPGAAFFVLFGIICGWHAAKAFSRTRTERGADAL